jgi:hypothetical protein
MDAIFGLAEDAKVPMLIHTGRGMPPIADGLVRIAMRHPEVTLILAHGAICDQGTLTAALADHDRVLYDSSCFFPLDVIELFARVPAERIVFATDPPYGRTSSGVYMILRVAAFAGLDEATTKLVLGETMAGLVDHGTLPPASAPRRGATVSMVGRLARLYAYCGLVAPALFMGAIDQALASLDLALSCCRDPSPGAAGEALETIGGALQAAVDALEHNPADRTPAIDLVYRSLSRAVTELPER